VTGPTGAVFLSYASQDGEAARRLCEALRAAGIEVWFDQSELRGGDTWDQKIRRQIRDCALFMPIISGHTQARAEGYFRLEWRLAEQRTHLMGRNRAFIVPVCVDDTPDGEADVPDSFSAVQWTRLPAGTAVPAFIERIAFLLLSHDAAVLPSGPAHPGDSAAAAAAFNGTSSARPSPWRAGRMALVAAGVIVAAGFLIAGRYVLLGHSSPSEPRAARSNPVAAAGPAISAAPSLIPEKSIAVLPFVDMSEKKDQEYFSDGLSEELIDLLAKVPDLRVPARTSSFYFKGQHATIAEIAKTLGVAQVLEGSVRKAGHAIRVTAQMVRADNGYHVWSETYDRDLQDVFKVQDEIAGAVVAALKLKLAPGPRGSSAHRTSNTEAYTQFLMGKQFGERATDVDGYRHAVAAYQKAIALDRDYAAAYAGLALAASALGDLAGDAAAMQQALAAAQRAVLLAPDQPEGYEARGDLRYTFGWDWSGAQADFEMARSLDPGNSKVQQGYGLLLASLGRLPEAIAATKNAIDLDPLSAGAWSNLGQMLDENGQSPAAIDALRRSLEIRPGNFGALICLGMLQLRQGNAAEALATVRTADIDIVRLTGIAMAEHSLGHKQESQRALDELVAIGAQYAAYQIAEAYAWRGEKDSAFAWLDRAERQHDGGLADIKLDAMLASLRSDPRYGALLRKMNLPQ
jgi:TolB-like protein